MDTKILTQPQSQEIWMLLDSSGFGGIESHVLQLAKGLKQAKEHIRIIFLGDYGPHPLHRQLSELNIPFLVCKPHWLKILGVILGVIHRHTPNLIHTHGYKAGIIGRCIAKLFQIKCVSTYHAGEKTHGKLAFYDWLDRKTAPLADHIYAVSTQISHRISVKNQRVNNFVPSSPKQRLSTGTDISFVGRLSYEKGPDLFLQLAYKNPHLLFHIYGNGPMEKSLKSIGLKNVIFHGFKNNMEDIWQKVGLLIMPSRQEGLPMVALEAMSHGIPVLATQVAFQIDTSVIQVKRG